MVLTINPDYTIGNVKVKVMLQIEHFGVTNTKCFYLEIKNDAPKENGSFRVSN